MEFASPTSSVRTSISDTTHGGRLWLAPHFLLVGVALLLFTFGCQRLPAPIIVGWLRCGMGARWLALNQAGSQLAIVCERSNDIWLHDLSATLGQESVRRFDTGWKPSAAIFLPNDDFMLVAERGVTSVAQVSLRDLRVRRRFTPAGPPNGLWLDRQGLRAVIGMQGTNALEIRRVKDLRPEKNVDLPGAAIDIVRAADTSGFFVSTGDADSINRVRARDMNVVASLRVGLRPSGMGIDPSGKFAWVACQGLRIQAQEVDEDAVPNEGSDAALVTRSKWEQGGLAVIRLADDRKTDFIALTGGPRFVQVSKSGAFLFVAALDGELRIFNSHDFKVVASMRFSSKPSALLLAPDGKRLYLAQYSERKIAIIDVESYL